MIWSHEVDLRWLKVRKQIITGTELAGLVPAYNRTMKQRAKEGNEDYIDPQFLILWSEKHSDEELVVEAPSSAAARGHIMEPYAIMDYNTQNPTEYYSWWDDCIIENPAYNAGFSPDGLDIPQPANAVHRYTVDLNPAPTKLIEVKSYTTTKHVQSIFVDASDYSERYQIAAAMFICPSIVKGTLLFYDPCLPDSLSMHVHSYTRDDLLAEMDTIEGVLNIWNDACSFMESYEGNDEFKALHTELEIWIKHMEDLGDVLTFER